MYCESSRSSQQTERPDLELQWRWQLEQNTPAVTVNHSPTITADSFSKQYSRVIMESPNSIICNQNHIQAVQCDTVGGLLCDITAKCVHLWGGGHKGHFYAVIHGFFEKSAL